MGILLLIVSRAVETGQPFSQVVQELTGAPVGVPATSGQKVPRDFKTEQEAVAAAKAGILTPGPDGTIHVIVNGVPGTLRPTARK